MSYINHNINSRPTRLILTCHIKLLSSSRTHCIFHFIMNHFGNNINSCKLFLPEGLKELMSDISREVLRSQPKNLYSFIANYLSALLVTRENINVATCLCDIPDGEELPELYKELRKIGLDDEQAAEVRDVVLKHFQSRKVKEGNLMLKLMKKVTIDEEHIPAIQEAVRVAYKRHNMKKVLEENYPISPESDEDDVKRAVNHTLTLYKKAAPPVQEYGPIAEKVNVAYHEYGVKRLPSKKPAELYKEPEKIEESEVSEESVAGSEASSVEDIDESDSSSWCHDPEFSLTSMNEKKVRTMSSCNVAGSITGIPKRSVKETISESAEYYNAEENVCSIDYLTQTDEVRVSTEPKDQNDNDEIKAIGILDLEVESDTNSDDVEPAADDQTRTEDDKTEFQHTLTHLHKYDADHEEIFAEREIFTE